MSCLSLVVDPHLCMLFVKTMDMVVGTLLGVPSLGHSSPADDSGLLWVDCLVFVHVEILCAADLLEVGRPMERTSVTPPPLTLTSITILLH